MPPERLPQQGRRQTIDFGELGFKHSYVSSWSQTRLEQGAGDMRSSQIGKEMLVGQDQTERVDLDGSFQGMDSLYHDGSFPGTMYSSKSFCFPGENTDNGRPDRFPRSPGRLMTLSAYGSRLTRARMKPVRSFPNSPLNP